MKFRLLIALATVASSSLLSGCGNAEEKAKAEMAAKVAAQNAEAERLRVAALTPTQRAAEALERACTKAKAEFAECEQKTGDAYVNCLASLHAPEGCGETSLQDIADHAAGTVRHK
jgi:outer membrane murein-binding lipoprotein Lpp